jgi:hypothetical protein
MLNPAAAASIVGLAGAVMRPLYLDTVRVCSLAEALRHSGIADSTTVLHPFAET